MDLTKWLLNHTPVRLLIAAVPGTTHIRLALENHIRTQGWIPAKSPAEANLLVVTGETLDPFVETVWDAMPAPRARTTITSLTAMEPALTEAIATLRDVHHQRSMAVMAEPPDHGSDEHSGHEMHGMGGHEHHMGAVGGVRMAEREADRDGMKLDVVHLVLGPVLGDWPAGLVMRAAVQGDVIQQAAVEVLGFGGDVFWEQRVVARRLDSCARLLGVAGWGSAAGEARWLRDRVLAGEDVDLRRWRRRVGKSRVLQWSLRGLGVLGGPQWDDTVYAGDAWDRLNRWLEWQPAAEPTQAVLDEIPALITGQDLAGARLVIASLDPDTDKIHAHG